MQRWKRRSFIKTVAAGAGLSLFPFPHSIFSQKTLPDLVVVKNGDPAEMVKQAVDELGGISRFVKSGQTVLIKPNIAWDRSPEYAATTHPEAVVQVIRMCKQAGADRILVLDRTCNQARRCYQNTGIEEAAKKAGAQVRHIIDSRFETVDIPNGEMIKKWPLYKDALNADVLINMPIAKHHSISRVTLAFKNMMGLMGGNRGAIHRDFMTKIVDINTAIKADLTLIDGYRVLLRNGPSGGNLEDVALKKTIVAGTDPVAADAYAARLLDVDPDELTYLKIAEQRGLGTRDLSKIRMVERTV